MLSENVSPALLLIVSGPAGSGKTTLCNRLQQTFSPKLQRVVSSTTRTPRTGEIEGKDYYFFDNDTFEKKIKCNSFYEWAKVHDHRYGILKSEIQEKLAKNIDLVLSIDVQGANHFREIVKTDREMAQRLVTIFILPQNIEQLKSRLRQRGNEDEAEIIRRMETAVFEIPLWKKFEHCIRSRSREEDFASLCSLYSLEKTA